MDCEKFDLCVMDALYGELDELTLEALKRHVEGCGRCGASWAGLKATRAGATLALEEPASDLERRVLAAERTAHRGAPWHRKIVRGAAWAGSHAMRPQLAMAALFMFVIGSSLLLLRARPGTMAPPVLVSEQGRPDEGVEQPAERARGMQAAPGKGAIEGDRDGLRVAPPPAAGPESGAHKSLATSAVSAAPGGSNNDQFGGGLGEALAKRDKEGCAAAEPALRFALKNAPSETDKKLAEDTLIACRKGDSTGKALPAAPTPTGPQATATATPPAPLPPP